VLALLALILVLSALAAFFCGRPARACGLLFAAMAVGVFSIL
jgi:hypothetical protein